MTSGRRKDPKVQEIIKKCEELGITYTTYLRRLQIGWTKEEALSIPRVGAVYRLKDGTPIYSYLNKIGKNYDVFNRFLHLGFSVEDALEHTLKYKPRTTLYRDGMSLYKWCVKNEVSYSNEYYKEKKRAKLSQNM